MTKSFFIISLLFASIASKAQLFSSDTLRPKAKEKQVSFSLNENSGALFLKKYTSAKFALRYGLGLNYYFNKAENTSMSFNQDNTLVPSNAYKSSSSSVNVNFTFGLQRSFGDYKNFEPYFGVDFRVGNGFQRSTSESTNLNPGFQQEPVVITQKSEYKSFFSPSATIAPFIGFNYYVAERFALGAEYRVSVINYSPIPPARTTNTTFIYSDGTKREIENPNESKGFNLSGAFNGSAFITATFFICGKK